MKRILKFTFVCLIALNLTNCNDDDDIFNGRFKTYRLSSVADPNISGTATFIENNDNSVTIELQLVGTPDGGMHPAHIHFNNALETGAIALSLGTVDGDTGFSRITTSSLDLGDDDITNDIPITYDELLVYDGYINVHLSTDNIGTLVAQGDIGENELVNSKTYALNTVDVDGISGTAKFEQRANGEALATLALTGTPDGGVHLAHIHAGSVATAPGDVILTFNPVDGTTGISKTNIEALDDDSVFGYNDVLAVDGYINVHLSANALETIVAQGDIGINE